MAKAPTTPAKKSTTPRKPAAKKPAAKKPADPVEDAEVIEERPAAPKKPAKDPETAKDPVPEKTPDPAPQKAPDPIPEPAPKDAETPGDARTSSQGPQAAPAPQPTPSNAPRRGGVGGFVGLLLGGVAAAVIGFAAARYVVPDGWPFPGVPPEEDPVAQAVAAQGTQIAGIGERLTGLESAMSVLQADTTADTLRDGLAGLDDRLGEVTTRLDEIETRLAAVEKLAPEGSAAAQMAAEAYDRELAALREMFAKELENVDAAQTDAATLEAQAAAAAEAAAGRAALAQVTAALDTGRPFADALASLSDSTGIAPPAALADVANDGVPTLAALQESFPEAARAALDASVRAAVENGEISRFTAFMRTQLGTRSLEPKSGDDADAVLSRAEAALKNGDLASVLAELDILPEAGASAFAGWSAMAQTREAALDAVAVLAQDLNAK